MVFKGNARAVFSINASNITYGVLQTSVGGTGLATIPEGQILYGSGENQPLDSSPDLSWAASNLTLAGNLLPAQNETFDLGSNTSRWRDIYLSGNTINLAGTQIKKSSDGSIKFETDAGSLARVAIKEIQLGVDDSTATRKTSILRFENGGLRFFETELGTDDRISEDPTLSEITPIKNVFSNFQTGAVGIGVPSASMLPEALLHVEGVAYAQRFQGNGSTLTGVVASGPIASTSTEGIVRLTDSVTTADSTLAATANAVKTAYDLASSKVSKSGDSMTGSLDITGNLSANTVQLSGASEGTPTLGGSQGDKVVLKAGTASSYATSLGLSNAALWYGTDAAKDHVWYVGNTPAMTLHANGDLFVSGDVVAFSSGSEPEGEVVLTANGSGLYALNASNISSGILTIYQGGTGIPALGGSGGDKVVLQAGTASSYATSLGLSNAALWYGTDATKDHVWYVGNTPAMTLHANGDLFVSGDVVAFSSGSDPEGEVVLTANGSGLYSLNASNISSGTLSSNIETSSILFGASLDTFSSGNTNHTNKVSRKLYGSMDLGGNSSVTVTHNFNTNPREYVVTATYADTESSTSNVGVIVTNKSANSFSLQCVPSNPSSTSMVDFVASVMHLA
jgi:hypothetical protein